MIDPVQYVVVRKDLPIAMQMVQVAHAASEAIIEAPVDPRTIVRLLHVDNEEQLIDYATKVLKKNFQVKLIREPDEPYAGAAMAFATAPTTIQINKLGKILFHLKKAEFAP